jgi:hypothetical protein
MKTTLLFVFMFFLLSPYLLCDEEQSAWQNAVEQASGKSVLQLLVVGGSKVEKLDTALAGKLWKACHGCKMLDGPECRCLPEAKKHLVILLEDSCILTIQLVQNHWFQAVLCLDGRVTMFYLKDSDNTLYECLEKPMNAKPKKTMCDKCAEMMFAMAMGKCTLCDNATTSMAFKLCRECAQKLGECQACRASLK